MKDVMEEERHACQTLVGKYLRKQALQKIGKGIGG
jgi:hypothetical protein